MNVITLLLLIGVDAGRHDSLESGHESSILSTGDRDSNHGSIVGDCVDRSCQTLLRAKEGTHSAPELEALEVRRRRRERRGKAQGLLRVETDRTWYDFDNTELNQGGNREKKGCCCCPDAKSNCALPTCPCGGGEGSEEDSDWKKNLARLAVAGAYGGSCMASGYFIGTR